MTSLRKFSFVLLVVATLACLMAAPAQAQLTLNCNQPSSITTTVNVPFSNIDCQASGGTPSYVFSNTGQLPPGISANSAVSEYVFEGTPTVIGTYSFTAVVTDNGGSGNTQSQSFTVNVTNGSTGTGSGLTLSSLSPSSEPAGMTFTLSLFGSGFDSTDVVFFNGYELFPTLVSSTQLNLIVSGTYVTGSVVSVYVRDTSSGASSGTVAFTVGSGSTGGGSVSISSISPTSIPLNTAFQLYIYGSGFSPGGLVLFGNNSFTSTYVSSGELVVNIPASALTTAGTVNVSVAGSNTVSFTIGSGGSSTGSLLITCSNTTGSISVGTFYTNSCSGSGSSTGSYFWSATSLPSGLSLSNTSSQTVYISGYPSISQGYTLTVTDNAGHSGSLTISPSGTTGTGGYGITSLSPSSAPLNTSETVIVYGNGFTTSSQVYFNGNVLGTQYVSAGQLNVTIPANLLTSSGTFNVFVNTPNIGSTNSLGFTVGSGSGTSGVLLSSISPTSVGVGTAGFTLTLFGSGFSQGTLITFGPYSLSTTFLSSGELTAFVPSQYLTTSQTVSVSVGGSNSIPFVIGAGSSGTLSLSCSPSTGPAALSVYFQQTCSVFNGTPPYYWNTSGLPAGVNQSSSNTSTVTISGYPSTSQSYAYTVSVNDSSGQTGSLSITGSTGSSGSSYNLTSLSPSSVTPGSQAINLTVLGNGFNSGSAIYFNGNQLTTTYQSVNQLSAQIPAAYLTAAESVSVTVNTAGIYTNSLTFTVGSGTSTGGTLTVFCTPGVGPSTVNAFYSTTCSASGGNQPYNWPTPTGLPAYLTYSSTTGPSITISGTPNVAVPYNFSVQVTDSSSPVQTGSLQLAGETTTASSNSNGIVLTSLSPTSAPVNSGAVTLNVIGGGFSFTSYVVFDGTPIVTTFLSSNQLTAIVPAGQLTFARSVLVDVTTPGAGTSNGLTFIIGNGGNGVQMSISCNPGVGPSSPNSYYTANCSVNGGTGPYNWTISSGSLPAGLTLTPSSAVASINGYATLNGTYNYTLQVTDSSSPQNTATLLFAGETGVGTGTSGGFSISTLSPSSTPVGSQALTLSVFGSGFTTASQVYYNGAPLSTIYVSTTQLTATIPAGDFTVAQSASVTVVSSGLTSNSLTFTVGNAASTPISISCNPTTGPSSAGTSYTTSCTVSGGRAPYTWSGVNLPFGLAVTNANGGSTVQITGSVVGAGYNYSLQVTDSTTPTALTGTYPFIGSFSGTPTSAINSMTPVSTPGGSGAFTLTITGYGFISGVSEVEFNGNPLFTSVLSSTQLTATVPANLVTSPGNLMVQLIGTPSNIVDFFVTAGGSSGVSPGSLSFTYGLGGTLPPAQTLNVTTLNGATGFSAVASGAADGINWLILNQASSVIPGSIGVSVSPAGLPIGSYSGTITLTGFSVGTSVVIPVTLNVTGAPAITPSTTNLTLTAPEGGSASQTINVTSSDGATVFPYKIQVITNNGGNFLSVSPTTGQTPGSFTITAAAGTLFPSTYSGSVTLTSTGSVGSQTTISVTFIVTAPGTLTANPASLSFSSVVGQSAPAAQNVAVTASSNATINYTVAATTAAGGNWLSATASGTTPGSISVSVTPGTLTAGTYNGTVTITAPGTTNSPLAVPVTYTVANPPALTPSPTTLTFAYTTGGSTPAAQTLSIAGPNNSGTFSFTVAAATTTGGNWLSASPTTGTTPGSVSVTINPANLTAGTYNGTLTITATGAGPATVPVTLTVTSPVVTLSVSPATLTFNASVGGTAPAAQTVSVSAANNVSAIFGVTPTSTGNWLSATATGTTPGTVSVSVNLAGLAVGQYTGSLSIASPGATNTPQTVSVTLNVQAAPSIIAIPGVLSFLVPGDGSTPAPQTVTIISSGANTAFTVSSVSQGGNWLTVGSGGTTPASFIVSVNPTGLVPGQTYNGSISISAPASNPTSIQIPVTLSLAPQGTVPLTAAPQSVYLSYTQGSGTDLEHVVVLNNGGGTVNFTAQAQTASCGSWLTVVTPTGSAAASSPGLLAFDVNPTGLNSQTCRGTLVVTDSNGNVNNIPVLMAVSGQSQAVLLSQTVMNFVTSSAGSAPPPQTFQILNPGAGSMPWTISTQVLSGGSWLSVAPNSGSSQSLAQVGPPITVSVNPQGLAPGLYYGTVQVTSSGTFNSPQSITVNLNVLPPPPPGATTIVQPQATPNGVIITISNGTSDTQTVNITNSNAAMETFSSAVITDDGQNWLMATPTSGSVAAGGTTAITLTANANGLAGGLRHGTLRIAFSDGSYQTVDVQLAQSGNSPNVTGVRPCTSSNLAMEFLTPSQNFTAIAGQAVPLQVLVKDCSGNLLTSSSTGVDVLVGSSDIKLNYTGNGVWAGTWTPGTVSPVTNLTARAVEVTGGSTATGAIAAMGNTGPFPASGPPYVAAVVNAASFLLPGLVAPGTMVSAFGSDLADGQSTVFSVPFPNALEGAQFMVRGVALPLFYSSPGQVNAIIPLGLNPNERDQLIVVRDTTQSAPIDLLVADDDPGAFATNQQGTGQGAILVGGTSQLAAPAGSVPGAAPATANQVISIFLSGLGVVSNPPQDGSPSVASNPSTTPATPTVTIGGVPATVGYSGLAPGEVGLYQINVTVPVGVPTGSAVPVVITLGNGVSNTVTMAIM